MKSTTLDEAIFEAKRFLERAEKLKTVNKNQSPNTNVFYRDPKEQGAVKRASLDLTRKLADLRAGR